MKIAGLDIGTTGCKLTVFDESGNQVDKAYRDYPVCRSAGTHEIDLSALLESVYAVLHELGPKYPDLKGIGVTSFGETCVLVDGAGTPLHNAMLYTDPRGAEECAELVHKLGAARIASITGLAPHEMYSISKLMWLKKHRPEVWDAARHIHLIEDLVVRHLTGRAQIDYSLASRTMAFDIHTLTWSKEVLDAAGIDPALLSEPVPTGTPAGTVTPEAAQRTGLSPACVIVSVSHDQVAAAVGAGAFDGSVAVDGAGTVECLTPIYDHIPDIEVMRKGFFSVVPYVVPGKYVAYAFSYTGGALMQWCMETFGKGETNETMERAYHGDAPTGLLVLPHFAGAATPYMDTGSKGAILGLTTSTTPAELYRACMEGVAYEMRLNYEALLGSGIRFERLHATGGGARSKVWMQMKADILNLPITALRTVDAGTVGSAMLTGVAVGLFTDLREAAGHMVQEMETYYPRPELHRAYMVIYERYKGVYDAVRPLVR
ncbi:carbohydrate kinase [Flavonifractor sp. An92]|uniref:FGGY-family carbohydrate kinase n=1 Tax=Flavonifractor sp. An92 TaxID=1965666 RepID=UPI000B399643|nr:MULTISPECIES: FGGY-family carbohydrate kinase [unclassified Flavonifractor]OUN06345.1 carbohydrate kinase [Flavonifractor sp. An92]OUQ23666.1 carbohydrate kinase [Flavonifractor sp. An135]